MEDLEYSEALGRLILHIQEGNNMNEAYALMLATFNNHHDEGETNRMAVVLAIKSIEGTERPSNP